MGNDGVIQAPVRVIGPKDGCVTISVGDKLIEVCCGTTEAMNTGDTGVYTLRAQKGGRLMPVPGIVDIEAITDVDWEDARHQVTVHVR